MLILLAVLLFLSLAANFLGFVVAKRFATRSLEFDNMFNLLVDDIDAAIVFMDGMLKKPLLSNAPEVVEMDRYLRRLHEKIILYSMSIQNNQMIEGFTEAVREEN